MQKSIILLGALTVSSLAYSQVGINNDTPKATLDVTAKSTGNTTAEGIIAPRLSGDDIKGKDTQYTIDQKGAIVYATAAVGSASTKTANITSEGYYYFDGTLWTKFGSGTATSTTEPFYVESTTTQATTNTQNIYQNGNLGLGNFSTTNPLTRLDVRGSVRVGGDAFTIALPTGGSFSVPVTPHTGTIGANSAAFGAGNEASGGTSFAIGLGSKAKGDISFAAGSGAQAIGINSTAIGSDAVANGGQSFAIGNLVTTSSVSETAFGINNAIKTTTSIPTNLWVPTDALFQVGNGNQTGPSLPSSALTILKNGYTGIGLDGVEALAKPTERLDIGNSNGSNSGYSTGLGGVRIRAINTAAYTGSIATDKVVVADANGVLKTVTVASVASSVEPWQVQGSTTPATTNAQNIYQTGNVSIGSSTAIAPFTSNSVTVTPKLSVAGDVASTGAFYTTTGKYADYVFEDYYDGVSKIDETYKFKSLEETAAYIKANKHLPGVTSIKDILKTDNGYTVNLSELSIQQLEKIEELYLHTIEQQQEIAKQKTEINDLKSRMEKLEQLLVKENNNK